MHHGFKQLQKNFTLADYNIQNEATLQIKFAKSGSPSPCKEKVSRLPTQETPVREPEIQEEVPVVDYSKVVLEASSEPEHRNSSDSDFHEVVYSRYHRASQDGPAKSAEGDSIALIEANIEEEEEEVPCN